MQKNTASQIVGAQMVSATDGSAFTGSVTVAVTIDGGTQATGSVGSGACTHEGNGYHTYAPAQAETNGNLIAFTFTGTGAVPATVQVYTTGFDKSAAQVPANVTQFGGSNGTFSGGIPAVNTTQIEGSDATNQIRDSVVDDATRIDASALNTASGAIGSDGSGLTEAGGTGDHLTALATAASLATVDGVVDTILARLIALGITTAAVQTNGSNSAMSFETDLSETEDDHWKDAFVVLTSGALAGQVKRVSAYNGTTKVITVSGGFTDTPADGVTFAIVNR